MHWKSILYLSLLFCKCAYGQSDKTCVLLSDARIDKIDSIGNQLKTDTTGSFVLFFNLSFSGKNAYGCAVSYHDRKISGNRLRFIDEIKHTYGLTESSIANNKQLLKKLFDSPDTYVKNLLGNADNSLTHDNAMYLLVQINGKIIFDKLFCRTQFLNTTNKNSTKLIMALQDMAR